MMKITRAQREALLKIYKRILLADGECKMSYRDFRKTAQYGSFDCIMVPFSGMWLGIEKDGYTHS